jgi:hypothetical protein
MRQEKSTSVLICLGRIGLPLVALPDALQGLDIGDILVITDADEPREAKSKPALVVLACLQLGVPHLEDKRGLECYFLAGLFYHLVLQEIVYLG